MDRANLLSALIDTLDDARVTRSERRTMREVLAETQLSPDQRLSLQQDLVKAVCDRLRNPADRELVQALGQAITLLRPTEVPRARSSAYFGPGDPMVETLQSLVENTRRSLDIAVFTLTDDRLSDAVRDAHKRGVAVRVLSDDDKAYDRGSDVLRLRDSGLNVHFDKSPYHFHHKFAVIDDRILVTGSYNWTRGAAKHNAENFLVTEDPGQVADFARAFDKMWDALSA
ncbi:MAG: phospholipase D-like domain-containing protein [Myxococcota bacterium]